MKKWMVERIADDPKLFSIFYPVEIGNDALLLSLYCLDGLLSSFFAANTANEEKWFRGRNETEFPLRYVLFSYAHRLSTCTTCPLFILLMDYDGWTNLLFPILFSLFCLATIVQIKNTVIPRYGAPAFNKIPPIKLLNFSLKKYSYDYSYVGNSKNLSLKYNFDQSLEMRYSGVQLYMLLHVFLSLPAHSIIMGGV